jgi:hypothetical protein
MLQLLVSGKAVPIDGRVVPIVPDRVIWSQLARSTCTPGFSSSVKICIAVYIILVLFVLFLLVMRIWVDLQVLKIWDLGSTLKSGQAKLSQASSVGSLPGHPQSTWLREDVESVYFVKEARMDSFAAAP